VDDVVLLHDARPHVANRTAARLQSFGWEIMEHAPYSPDLAPSDYHVFGPLKKFLEGQRFRAQPAEFYNSGISKVVVRWDKCLNRGGDYVEKHSKVLRTLPVF
jgi:histone-lysine N-methyltransferase SETMAR